jgi:threonine dehydratase
MAPTSPLIPLEHIQAAQQRLRPYLNPSPLVRADAYSARLGCELAFKLELLLPTHAFKVRGALNALLSMSESARALGVVTASGGNHGLGLAYAARQLGVRAVIALPTTTPQIRVDTIRSLGGEVVIHGDDWNAANDYALSLASEQGYTYLSPFDDPQVMAGQGTVALEILEQAPDAEVIVCSVGGGGLISGVISAVKQLRPAVRVVGVETLGADCVSQSLVRGELVTLPRFSSIAESLGTKRSSERPFAIIRAGAERVVAVPDARAVEEMLYTLNREKLLVEPAASCTLAALTDGLIPDLAGRVVVSVICGGNITLEQLERWRERFIPTETSTEGVRG